MKKSMGAFLLLAFIFGVFGARVSQSAQVANVSFPAESTYNIMTSKGPALASVKYAPPIKDITFNQSNLSTHIGNNFKNIFWIANRYGGGPAGRWDISDPWNPKDPDVVGIAYGGSAFANSFNAGKQPASHRGPFYGSDWPHTPSLRYMGGSFGETKGGEGRFVFGSGEEGVEARWNGTGFDIIKEGRGVISPIISVAPGQGLAIGQLLDGKWQGLFEGVHVIDASASGKFFFIAAGGSVQGYGSGGAQKNPLEVFDISDLTGDLSPTGIRKNPISSQPWQNITELKVIEVPGQRNHFVIARTGADIDANPRFYIGEIDADIGRITRQNSFTLPIQGVKYKAPWSPGAVVLPGSNLDYANVSNNSYIFMNESFTRNGVGYSSLTPGTLKIGAYKFNPADLTFTKKGDMSLKNFPNIYYADRKSAWNIAREESGKSYPMLMAIKTNTTKTEVNSYGQTQTFPTLFYINLYSLKELIDASSPISVVPENGDVIFPAESIKRPVTIGQIITVGAEQDSQIAKILGEKIHYSFIKSENGKNNVYLYRKALLFDGRHGRFPEFAYDERPAEGGIYNFGTDQGLGSGFAGVATMRIDRADVSAFTGGTTTTPNPTNPIPPYVPPPSSGSCVASLTFDKASVAYGGSMTENWTVNGADIGQVYGDCGAGPTAISAGPQSYTFNNLTKTMTCRVYGKIDGQEACTTSATVTVGAPTGGGDETGGNPENQLNYASTENTAFQFYYQDANAPVDAGTVNLRQGLSGTMVASLQISLNQKINAGLSTDGKFGPKTKAAVISYQESQGLVVDGIVGPKTRAALGL